MKRSVKSFMSIITIASCICFLSLLTLPLASIAQESSPIEIRRQPDFSQRNSSFVFIVSTENEVVIEDVVINRRNLFYMPIRPKLPAKLGYGEDCIFFVNADVRRILEVEVKTNKGTWIKKFN